MPAALKKRYPVEPEPGEGKAHEQGESPEEEVREGSESEEMPRARGTRKRSSKGARKTKAPMDSDCGCGGGKDKPCSCKDSDCGYSKKMDSALTPQEYLAACDLGIQDRSRSYIRTRLTVMDSLTPATVQFRTDKKCGGSAIPDNKQCHVGAGGGGSRLRRGLEAASIAGGAAAFAGGLIRSRRQIKQRNYRGAMRSLQAAQAGQSLAGAGLLSRGLRKKSETTSNIGGRLLGSGLVGVGMTSSQLGDFKRARGAAYRGAKSAARGAGFAAGTVYARARNAVRRAPTVSGQSMGSSTPGRRRASVRQQAYRVAKGASYAAGRAAGRAAGTVARMGQRRGRGVPYGYGGALRRRGDDVWADGFTPEYA